jgi:hypothetical protein
MEWLEFVEGLFLSARRLMEELQRSVTSWIRRESVLARRCFFG